MQWSVFWFGNQDRVLALVISSPIINETLDHVTVLPVVEANAGRAIYPTEAACTMKHDDGRCVQLVVLAHQVRTLRRSDMGGRAGAVVSPADRRKVLDAVGVQLGVSIHADGMTEEADG